MKSTASTWRRGAALVTVAWFASAPWTLPAFAADPPTKAAPSKQTKSKAKPISRDQLRACMDQQDLINGMREKVLQQQASLDQQRADVARMDSELARKRAAPEPLDEAATKALNDEEVRRNELSDSYNARLPGLKEQASTLEKERQSWVERCAGKDFDELDEFAIKRERQRAASTKAK